MLSCHSLPNAQWASEEPPLQILHSFKVLTSDQRTPVKDQGKKTMAEAHLALQSEHVRLGEIPLGRKKPNTAEHWVPDYTGVTQGRTWELLWRLPA